MKYNLVLEDLRGKLSDIEDILLYEINNIENNRERQNNDKFTKTLENIKQFDKIIQGIRNQQLINNNISKEKREQYKKAEQEWKRINSLVDKYDALLPNYIKKHPNCGLLPIRKRIGYNFQKSIKTKYFNY